MLLTDFLLRASSACSFYTHQDHLPRSGLTYSELGTPTLITNLKKKCTTGLLAGQSSRGIFSIEVLSSKMTAAYVSSLHES